ncbi:Uncharacterised protein [Vibrio cholerae]|nr:Uncharacterised protein [Vibrio cholerae]CSC29051.1 Uncharacterised protein [Vibrio cholerae]
MPDSLSTQHTSPTLCISCVVKALSASLTESGAYKPLMPRFTSDGVLGITRTKLSWVASISLSLLTDTPAAIEITNFPEKSTACSGLHTSAISCGLTANTTTSACCAAARLSLVVRIPYCASRGSRRVSEGAVAMILSAA